MKRHTGLWRLLAVLTIAALFQPLPAISVDYTWTGGTGYWDDSANWNPASVPGSGATFDGVTIDVAGVQTITHRTGSTAILTLTNAETLVINGGSTLRIWNASTNTGTIRADNGTLNLYGTFGAVMANGGGTLAAINSGVVEVRAWTIQGGSLSTDASGQIRIYDSSVLDGSTAGAITNLGNLVVMDNSTGAFAKGTIVNSGDIRIGSPGGSALLAVQGGAGTSLTFSGTGTVTLSDSVNAVLTGNSGTTIVNSAGHTMQGAGRIGSGVGGAKIVNQGLIEANSTAQMYLWVAMGSDSWVNTGTLRASNTGGLLIQGGTIINSDGVTTGRIEAVGAGAIVTLGTATIQGGTFATSGGGEIRLFGNTRLDGASAAGAIVNTGQIRIPNQFIYAYGTIDNSGDILLDSTGVQTTIAITGGPNATLTLSGTGTLTMSNFANNQLTASEGNDRLINAAGHTIQGAGNIGANSMLFTNQGLVNANQTVALTINPSDTALAPGGLVGVVNTSILRGSNTGGLILTDGVFDNAGGTIEAVGAGAHVTITGFANLQGGLVTSHDGGEIRLVGPAVLDGATLGAITNTGTIRVVDGSNANAFGTINNAGTIQIGSATGAGTLLIPGVNPNDPDATLTLAGNGTLAMSNFAANTIQAQNFTNRLINSAGHTIQGSGNIGVATMAFTNAGLVVATQSTPLILQPSASGVTNTGTLQADGGTLDLRGLFTNTGGTLDARNSSVAQLTGATVVGGTLTTSAGGVIRTTPGNLSALDGVTLNGTYVAGDGTSNTTTRLVNTITNNGTLAMNSGVGGGLVTTLQLATGATDDVTLAGTGVLAMANSPNNVISGQTGVQRLINSAGHTIQGAGRIDAAVLNSGLVRATGSSSLVVNRGIVGPTGTIEIAADGILTFGGATNSSAGLLIHNGSAANSLNLGSSNVTVYTDYINANFGTGNSFNAHANTIPATPGQTSGRILAAGTPEQAQILSGVNLPTGWSLTGGATATPTLTIGNVHVGTGTTTFDYQIANNNTGGPALRGAIQTTGGGANITDPRLSGSGVTAGNFGPIAPGGSAPLSITFNAGVEGPLSPLTGQVVRIANNFDNVVDQNMSIVLGAGAAAYNLANAFIVPNPASVPNQRVGGTVTQALTVENRAVPGIYTEGLNASFGASTGDARNNGGTITRLAGGTSNSSAMTVWVDTSTAGFKSGNVTVNPVSDGTGTSGLGLTPLSPWTIFVNGHVYQAATGSATPSPITLVNQRVGGSLTQALTVANTAPAGDHSEDLNAAFGANTGNATSSGTITGRVAGTNNTGTGTMTVGVDTSAAGARTGTVTINYQTAGAVNGASNGLGAAPAGSQTINVSGNVYRLATASAHTPEPVNLGNIHVGGSFGTQALTLQNTAANDGFSERLNASIGGVTGAATASGTVTRLTPQATDSTSLVVGLGNANTATAGTKTGTATITLQSDGTGTSGFGAVGIGSQTVNVSGNVYRLAQATINNAADFNFGNVLAGSGPITRTLSIGNTATADGFSEALNAAFGSFTNNGAGIFSNNGGTITGLLAGQTNATAMTVTMTPTSAGTINASVALQFASNGTAIGNGLGVTALPAQDLPLNVTITGVVGNLAQASAATPNPVNFGKFRVGAAAPANQVLTIGNVATAPAEGLNASIATASSGFSATGAFTSLAPGATNNTSLAVGFTDTATAGAKSGTATITLASDGTFNSGVPTPLTPQTINMNAEVYRLAAASAHTPEPVTLANQRVGGTATQALSLTNTAANDGYSERLNATLGGATAGITTTGSIGLLAAGATNSSSLRVGVDTATAGAKSGTATLTLQSDGTGTSGFSAVGIGTQTVNVSGNVYRLAAASAHTPAPVTLANQRVGGTATQALSLTNTAATDGFSEKLNASIVPTSGQATASGAFNLLAAGATDNTNLRVGVDTATAGAKSGTATITLASDGTGTSGFSPVGIGTQTVTVSGNVYRLATPVVTGNLNFGNVLVGSTQERFLTVANNALADGFSEGLNAGFGTITGTGATLLSGSGTLTNLAAGSSDNTTLKVTLATGSTGTVNANVEVLLASNGATTSGLGVLNLPSQYLQSLATIEAQVGNLAVAGLSPTSVNFGKFREGQVTSQTQALTITNLAAAPAEGLNAGFGATTGGASNNGGTITSLAAGSSNNTAMSVSLNGLGTAGAKSGTATVTFASDGTFNSGVPTPLAPQQVAMNAEVYRLAAASAHTPEPVTLANQRVGGTATQALSLTNTAAADGYSEKLNASIAPTSGQATASGAFNLLAAGATDNTNLRVGVDTATAGAKSGTATLTLQSDGTGTSGFGAVGIGTQTVNVQGNVYQVAQPTLASNNIVFTNRHVGDAATQALSLTNTSAAPAGFQEGLNASFSGTTGSATASGTITNLGQGTTNTASLLVGVDTTTAGAKSGTATLALASNGTVSGLADLPLANQTVNISGTVYRLAAPNTIAAVDFGSVHVGDLATRALTISNTAAADGFSEKLNASFGGVSDPRITTSGAINLLAAGATDSSSMVVGLNTAAAGTVSGSATVRLQSDGTGTSGLGTTNLPDQNVGVTGVIATGDVYRLANPVIQTPQPVAFGNVRIGTTVASQALAIKNDVPADGYSEKLNASANGTTGGVTASGAFTLLAPQGVDTTSILVGLDTTTAGNRSGQATINFVSDGTGTSGLGQTPLLSQNVQVTGNVFRLAAGNAGDVNLGNFHVGANASGALTVTNTAANDGYSEKLNASVTGFTPAVTGTSGGVSLLAAGSSATTISATLGNVQAGANSGAVTLAYQSDGNGTTGAPAIDVGTQTVTVQATGYRLANPVINNPGAFSFGNVHQGDLVQQALSITNSVASDGYSEKLNASFGGTSDARILTNGGSVAGLGAGSTDATSMVLGVNTGAAGAVNGTATVTFASDGTGTSGLGQTPLPSQDVTVTATIEGDVYRLANPVIQTPQPIAFGNVRIGTAVASQALAIKNDVPADGFSEKLNASANGTTGGVTASGAFTLLAPQGVDTTSILVGLDTTTAGNRSGQATINFVSDGTGTSGLGQTPLLSQNVQVTGNVFRLANPVVNTPTVTLAARVGDVGPITGISLTNSSPDIYTEGLKASVNTVPAGFTNAGGTIGNLAAQGSDASTLKVGLVTATAGSFSGDATLTLASTGAGTTGASDLGLSGQNVRLSGKVYTPAVASVAPASLDFGIVHVGDAVAQKVIGVTNSAPVTALNDVLTGNFAAPTSGPFTASGTLGAGVAAGVTDSASLKVGLNTATAGSYASIATLQLQSHNPDISDLALSDQTVSLAAQVNNYARPVFEQVAGGFSLTQDGTTFTLDFGSLIQGTGLATASLGVRNDVTGPADVLNGTFERVGATAFQLSGFTDFFNIAAGDLFGGLSVGLDTATLGLFDYSLVLHPYGTNASGFFGSLGDLTLALHAKVVTSASVPEASTLLLLGIGLAGLAGWRWRNRGTR